MIHPDNNTIRVIEGGGFIYWCAGCETHHVVYPAGSNPNGAQWKVESTNPLTLSPSVKHRFSKMTAKGKADYEKWVNDGMPKPCPESFESEDVLCHYFIRGGKIQYLNDCTHSLKGKTVDMVKMDD